MTAGARPRQGNSNAGKRREFLDDSEDDRAEPAETDRRDGEAEQRLPEGARARSSAGGGRQVVGIGHGLVGEILCVDGYPLPCAYTKRGRKSDKDF